MADENKAQEPKAPVSAASEAPKKEASQAKAVSGSHPQGFNHNNGNRGNGGRSFGGGFGRRDNNRRGNFRRQQDPYADEVIDINKIAKVEVGGKHIRFAALVVIGDGKGKFGFGQGKSPEVPEAIKKAVQYAHSYLVNVPLTKDNSIPHEVRGKCGVCEVFLKPAPAGTGIIAGGAVRSIMQLAGVKNIYSKTYGRRTPINVVRATIDAIKKLKTKEYVEKTRLGINPAAVANKPVADKPTAVKEATK